MAVIFGGPPISRLFSNAPAVRFSTLFSPTRLLPTILLLAVLALGACKTLDPEDRIPAYLHINTPRLVLPTGDTVQSYGTVPDIWLLQENEYLGTFEPPVTVPIINLDQKRFFLSGGIWKDGSPAFRQAYLFWASETLQAATLTARDTVFVTPVLRYRPDTISIAAYTETFENVGYSLEEAEGYDSIAPMTLHSVNAFQGNRCLKVSLDTANNRWAVQTNNPSLRFPTGRPLFLEVSYRGNVKFGFLLQHYIAGTNPLEPIRQYMPTSVIIPEAPGQLDKWQTVYIDLRPLVAQTLPSSPHKLFFYTELPEGRTEGELYLDYIRVVTTP